MKEPPTATNHSRWRGVLPRLLPLLVGGGLLTLILTRTNLAQLGAVLSQLQWQWYALAQLMLVVSLLFVSGRWRYDLGLLQLRYPFVHLFLIDNAGALAGAATPGRVGDLARLVYFRQETDVLLRVGLSILVERGFDLLCLVLLSTGFLWFFPLPPEIQRFVFNLVLAAYCLGLGLAVIAWRSWGLDWLSTKALRVIPGALAERFSGCGQELKAALGRYGTWRLVWPLTMTLLAWGCNILAAYCCIHALSLPLNLWQTGACYCFSTLFTLVPVSVAGIGTRELAMVFLFSCLGLPSEKAVAFSFLLLGFLLTHSLIGFLALLLKPPHSWQGGNQRTASA